MAKATNGLTAKSVGRLKAGRYHDHEHRGLYLQVTDNGDKSWLLRYEHDGRERWMGLGSARDFSLREARERARDKRQLLADGIDPIDAKISAKDLAAKESRERQTFRQAADEFLKLHAPGWRNDKHRAQWRSTLAEHAYPETGNAVGSGYRHRADQRHRRPDLDQDARDGTACACADRARRTMGQGRQAAAGRWQERQAESPGTAVARATSVHGRAETAPGDFRARA